MCRWLGCSTYCAVDEGTSRTRSGGDDDSAARVRRLPGNGRLDALRRSRILNRRCEVDVGRPFNSSAWPKLQRASQNAKCRV